MEYSTADMLWELQTKLDIMRQALELIALEAYNTSENPKSIQEMSAIAELALVSADIWKE